MSEYEQFKKPKGLFKNVEFVFRHEVTPSLAERARNICLANQLQINLLIEDGLVTSERLREIGEDKMLQKKYEAILRDARNGRGNINEVLCMMPDERAGWLVYFRDFHEKHWNIKLLTNEERAIKFP